MHERSCHCSARPPTAHRTGPVALADGPCARERAHRDEDDAPSPTRSLAEGGNHLRNLRRVGLPHTRLQPPAWRARAARAQEEREDDVWEGEKVTHEERLR